MKRTLSARRVGRFLPYPEYKQSGVDRLGAIPAHWAVDRFKSTVTGCQNGVWGEEPDGINDIMCVRVADFDRVALQVDLSGPTLRSLEKRALRGRTLKAGDLLLEKSGGGEKQPVGAVVVYQYSEPAVCSNFVARMPVGRNFSSRFLAYAHAAAYAVRLNTCSIKQNTGIQNLDSSSYLAEQLCLPPLEEQAAIAEFLDLEAAKIDVLMARKERLVELLEEKRSCLVTWAVTKGLESGVPMKKSDVDWHGTIPAHWTCIPIAFVTNSRCDGPFGSNLKSEHYRDQGVRVVRLQNVGPAKFLESDEAYIDPEHSRQLGDHSVKPSDLLVAGLGDDVHPAGRACVAPAGLGEAIVKADCFRLRLDLRRVVPQFVAYQLSAGAGAAAGSLATGATRSRMNLSTTSSLKLALPPLGEQQAIADRLVEESEKLSATSLKVAEAIKRLKEYRTAIISAAITGRIDVRKEVA